MKSKTIEQRTGETILQRTENVQLGSKTFNVTPPTLATLIRASELISLHPPVEFNPGNPVWESLKIAKDCKVLGDIMAVLILGDGLQPQIMKLRKNGLLGFLMPKTEVVIDPYKDLGSDLINNASPEEFKEALLFMMSKMEFGHFSRYYHFPHRSKSSESDKKSGNLNDSPWAFVAGIAKGYNLTFDYVLYKMSYANMILYSSVLPSYDDGKDDAKEEVINADDPKNKEAVKKILFG